MQHFADGCHHRKEEDGLFPAMEARGFDAHRGPTAVMRSDHVRGRDAIQAMKASLAGARAGDRANVASFVCSARAYVELLRIHITKEDHRLFPMADAVLSEQAQAELLERFENVEHEDVGAGAHERYLMLADELAEKFGVPRASHAACATCGSQRR